MIFYKKWRKNLFESGFEAWATPQERTTALIDAGISEATIASAIGVGIGTVQKWHAGTTETLRGKSFERLDNLRTVMEIIIENGVDPDYAAAWIQSPMGDNPENIPISFIKDSPAMVINGIRKIFGAPGREEFVEPDLFSFGKILNKRRQKRNVTLREFEREGIASAPNMSAVENGKSFPKPDKRDIIINHLSKVAEEQGANGDEERESLLVAWWGTQLSKLDVSPEIISTAAELFALSEKNTTAAAKGFKKALEEVSE